MLFISRSYVSQSPPVSPSHLKPSKGTCSAGVRPHSGAPSMWLEPFTPQVSLSTCNLPPLLYSLPRTQASICPFFSLLPQFHVGLSYSHYHKRVFCLPVSFQWELLHVQMYFWYICREKSATCLPTHHPDLFFLFDFLVCHNTPDISLM